MAKKNRRGMGLRRLKVQYDGAIIMQFTILINQQKSVEWGLDLKLAGLFAFLYQVPSWATDVNVGGKTWYWISRKKILEEVPVLGVTACSVYRYMKELEKKGLIILSKEKSIGMTLMRLTPKAKEWNNNDCSTYCKTDEPPIAELQKGYCKTADVSVNQLSDNHEDHKPPVPSDDGTADGSKSKSDYPSDFEATWRTYPKRSGGNPKRSAFKAWNARIKAGHSSKDILLGVERYRKFIAATGKQNTQFVMQAATFFGPDERFSEEWDAPTANVKQNGMAQPKPAGSYEPESGSTPEWLKDLKQ